MVRVSWPDSPGHGIGKKRKEIAKICLVVKKTSNFGKLFSDFVYSCNRLITHDLLTTFFSSQFLKIKLGPLCFLLFFAFGIYK